MASTASACARLAVNRRKLHEHKLAYVRRLEYLILQFSELENARQRTRYDTQNRQPFSEPAIRISATYSNGNAQWCCAHAPCRCAHGQLSNVPFLDRGGRYHDDARPGGDDGLPPHDGLLRYDGARSKDAVVWTRPLLSP
jgi:hypothetical protein